MTFTFDLGNDIGKVRFEVGDTVGSNPLFTDEEITYKLTEHGGQVLPAAAALCDVRATQLAGVVDFKTDDQEFKNSQARLGWEARAASIRARLDTDAANDLGTFDTARAPINDLDDRIGRQRYYGGEIDLP